VRPLRALVPVLFFMSLVVLLANILSTRAEAALDLRVRASVRSDGVTRAFKDGDALRSGDRLELFARVSRAAYVYVVQFDAAGTATVVFPRALPGRSAQDYQIPAGAEERIPDAKGWLELDDSSGEEHLYLIATTKPLRHADRALDDSLRSIRRLEELDNAGSGSGVAKTGNALPAADNLVKNHAWRRRAIHLVYQADTQSHAARGNDNVTIFELSFRHLPRER